MSCSDDESEAVKKAFFKVDRCHSVHSVHTYIIE